MSVAVFVCLFFVLFYIVLWSPNILIQRLISKKGSIEDVEERFYRKDKIFKGMKKPVNSGHDDKFSKSPRSLGEVKKTVKREKGLEC